MARKPMKARKYARKHNKMAKRTKAINFPQHVMRGGIRL
jgi:hypothetical protein